MFFPSTEFFHRKEKEPLPARKSSVGCEGRTSVSAFKAAGSLTLEAACILPLFLWAVLAMLYFADAAAVQARVAGGIHSAARELAIAAAAAEMAGREDGESLGLAGNVLSSVYARELILRRTGTLPEDLFPAGLRLTGSEFLENEMIDLKVSADLRIPVPFLNIQIPGLWQRGYVRAWTGRSAGDGSASEDNGDGIGLVYVTATGTVYHKDPACTHIRLSIRQVLTNRVETLRSADGSKYYPCSCCDGSEASVYITKEGNRYHGSRECRALKRSVRIARKEEVLGMRACSKCG